MLMFSYQIKNVSYLVECIHFFLFAFLEFMRILAFPSSVSFFFYAISQNVNVLLNYYCYNLSTINVIYPILALFNIRIT